MTDVPGLLVAIALMAGFLLSLRQAVRSAQYELHRVGAVRHYWARACQGRAWRRAFPQAHSDEIRNYLAIITASFGFQKWRGLYFSPDDQVLGLYRQINPRPDWPDQMELETFVQVLEQEYKIEVQPIWREDITFGEVLRAARAA
jgi:propanediol dehydratase small subunit